MQKALIVFGIVLIMLASGCTTKTVTKESAAFVENFRVGTQGLAMRFTPNMPPTRLFSGEQLSIVVELENRGTFPVGGPGDRIYISGFDPNIISGISPVGEQIPLLEGRTQFISQGGFDTVSFKANTRILQDKYPVTLLATACYEYETVATGNVCIDPNPYAPAIRQRVCVPQNIALGGGQGAPIAVNAIEVDASPGKTRFKIRVSNVGGGEVFRSGGDTLNRCGPGGMLGFDEVDYVELEDVIVSGVSIRGSCRPLDQGHIRLTNKQGVIYCEFDRPPGDAAYVTPITVVLRYGYRDSIIQYLEILPSV
ncbi:MAG: hypothetical protein QXM31_01980 [Candidatus Woesearchaeota archaeon]